MAFCIVVMAFPTAPGPDANGMNYMVVVYGGWIGLCLVYYYFPVYGGACRYNGLRITLEETGGFEAAGTDEMSDASEKLEA